MSAVRVWYSIGVVLLVLGAVFVFVLPDLQFLWFTGRPLGIVLAIVGAVEIGGGASAFATGSVSSSAVAFRTCSAAATSP